jgi:hypothetical protein
MCRWSAWACTPLKLTTKAQCLPETAKTVRHVQTDCRNAQTLQPGFLRHPRSVAGGCCSAAALKVWACCHTCAMRMAEYPAIVPTSTATRGACCATSCCSRAPFAGPRKGIPSCFPQRSRRRRIHSSLT